MKKEIKTKLAKYREGHQVGYSIGFKTAETFGRMFFTDFHYDYFLKKSSWFTEVDVGAGGWFTRYKPRPIFEGEFYNNDWVISIDMTLGYKLSRQYFKNNRNRVKSMSFLIGGPTAVYQGGFYNLGSVYGLGGFWYFKKWKKLGLQYIVKDRIYWPKVSTEDFLTHNVQFSIGLQYKLIN